MTNPLDKIIDDIESRCFVSTQRKQAVDAGLARPSLDPVSPDAYSWSPPADRAFVEAYDAGYLNDLAELQGKIDEDIEALAKAYLGGWRQRVILGIDQDPELPIIEQDVPSEGIE